MLRVPHLVKCRKICLWQLGARFHLALIIGKSSLKSLLYFSFLWLCRHNAFYIILGCCPFRYPQHAWRFVDVEKIGVINSFNSALCLLFQNAISRFSSLDFQQIECRGRDYKPYYSPKFHGGRAKRNLWYSFSRISLARS